MPNDTRPMIVTDRLEWSADAGDPLLIDLAPPFAEAHGEM